MSDKTIIILSNEADVSFHYTRSVPDMSKYTGFRTEFDAATRKPTLQQEYVEGAVVARTLFNPIFGYRSESSTYDADGKLHGVLRQYNPLEENLVLREINYEHGVRGETKHMTPPTVHRVPVAAKLTLK